MYALDLNAFAVAGVLELQLCWREGDPLSIRMLL
jgi:hypothetical protein